MGNEKEERQKRDDFVNKVLASAGYTLIRTYGDLQPIKDELELIKNGNKPQ